MLLTGDIDEDAPFELKGRQIGEMNVAMSVPLRIGDRVIGVLNVGSSAKADKQWFSKDEKRFACLFAEHAAIAVDRAGLIDSRHRVELATGTVEHEFPMTSAVADARETKN